MDVFEDQKLKIDKVGRDYELRFIIMHGSFAKGIPTAGSDLDIALVGKKPISFDGYSKIQGELGSIFGDNPGRELDIKTLHGVDPLFLYEAVINGVLLYGDTNDFEEYKNYAYKNYMDSYDLRRLGETLLKKSIRAIEQRYAK